MNFNRAEWRSHRRGQNTRQQILAHLKKNPTATTAELASAIGVTPQQIKRQLTNLRINGQLQICPKNPGKILISLTLSGFLFLTFAEILGASTKTNTPTTTDKQWLKPQQSNPKQTETNNTKPKATVRSLTTAN